MSGTELGLRPEGRSVHFVELAPDQRRVFAVLLDLLVQASNDLDLSTWYEDPKPQGWADANTTSRVLLLGGGRGSGKTTVARTLERTLQKNDTDPLGALAVKGVVTPAEGAEIERKVERLRKKVIVLQP